MNPHSNLETMLRGWRPRPPSPKIRNDLFPPAVETRTRARVTPAQGWFAPLTAAALVVLTMATVRSAGGSGRASLSYAALPNWESGVHPIDRNAPPSPRFRSTNAGVIASSFGSLLLRQTNVFAR